MDEVVSQPTLRAEDRAFEFTAGVFGFPGEKRYVIADIPGGGDIFKQMVSLDSPDVGFTLVYPFAFFPDYAPDISEAEIREIGAEGPEQIMLMAIANVPGEFQASTANLKAPIIFNPYTRKARQVILMDEQYATRHRLFKG